MTVVQRPVAPTLLTSAGGGVVVLLGVGALLVRPAAARLVDDPVPLLVGLFLVLGMAGLWWPVPSLAESGPRARDLPTLAVLGVGMAAFAGGRLLAAGPDLVLPAAMAPVLANGLAAVAEEAFFRRLLYGLLEPRGRLLAVVGSAVAFAVVHVTVWGPGVLPLDLVAGLILSWQRAACGRWTVPAATHVAANLLALL